MRISNKAKSDIVVWTIITVYLWATDPVIGPLIAEILGTSILIANYCWLYYYLSFFAMPKFGSNKLLSITYCLCGYFAFVFVDFANFNSLLPMLGVSKYVGSFGYFLTYSYYSCAIVAGFALANYIRRFSVQRLETQKEREKLLLLKELNFLKSQFSSHITFNFLNYCYSKVYKLSGDAADAIELFSSLLRYSLVTAPGETVSITREIEYIKDFIALQKLLSKDVCVVFTYDGNLTVSVVPCVLVTFVENAFKHGDINCASDPIHIHIQCNDMSLRLMVENRKRRSTALPSTGIGLTNVKQILSLYYPDKYDLNIVDAESKYICNLKVSLS